MRECMKQAELPRALLASSPEESLKLELDEIRENLLDVIEVRHKQLVEEVTQSHRKKKKMLETRKSHLNSIQTQIEQSKKLASRLGVRSKMRFVVGDPTEEPLGLTSYDHVLVDAPCTGLGTLRRHPETAWRRTKEDIFRLGKLQKSSRKNASKK